MKFLIYIECLIIFTLYEIIMALIRKLQYLGKSSEWYAERGLHAFQARKAIAIYNKEYAEDLKKKLKEIKK